MSSAVSPLRNAVDQVLLGDSTYNAKIAGRSYLESQKPENAVLPFQSYGLTTERAWRRFHSDGNEGRVWLHLYGDDEDVVAGMWGDVERLLNDQEITVSGHSLVQLSAVLLSNTADPVRGAHGIVAVTALTIAGA